MSHNHYLECRACGARRDNSGGEGHPMSCYAAFSRLHGDGLIEHALSIRQTSIGLLSGQASVWFGFISQHAGCNAFWEVCEQGPREKCNRAPRRILVQGAIEPPCKTCCGRRLVECPSCSDREFTEGEAAVLTNLAVARIAFVSGDLESSRSALKKALKELREGA